MESNSLTERITKLSSAKRELLEAKLKQNGRASAENAIARRADRDSAPLSFAQQRLWFLNQLDPDCPVYNESRAVRLNGFLDVAALSKSLNQIVARHEVLRTTIVPLDGTPLQVITNDRTIELPEIDLGAIPDKDRDTEVQRLITETIRRPFDLSRALMLRCLLLRLADQEHIFVVVKHHIASDGWSSGIFWRELSSFYGAFTSGQACSLPEIPVQYSDYAVWQRKWLQGKVLESQLSYWKKQLDSITALQLPTDRPRPAVQSFRGAWQSLVLPKQLSEALKALSRKEEVTLFMTLLAAFQTLLHRYTGQRDIAVGSPIAGRNRAEYEGLIGFFVNTLVLRVDLSGNPTYKEVLSRVREVALGAYGHQDVPFEKLVEELQPERNLSHSPLFQVAFAFQNGLARDLELPGLVVRPIGISGETAKFDLHLSIVDDREGLKGRIHYCTDLFYDSTIARMLTHFKTLLEGIVANPEQRLSDLPILTEAERHQLLVEWNDTKRDYSKDKCLHQLFEEQVDKSPNAVAVVFEDEELTYRELNNRANQLARYLQNLGVGPNVLVGICTDRSIELVVGLLAILKAGAAYLPVDPDMPRERIEFMLEDSHAAFLLTQTRTEELFPLFGGARISFDRDWQKIARESATNVSQEQRSTNLAYVIYTSGSTGKPKGVMIHHSNVVNFLASMAQKLGLTESDIFLAVTTFSFDIAGLELYLPLTVGARVVLARREIAADGIRLARQLLDCGATVMQATPATWRMLLESGWRGNKHLKILCGGETLSPELASQLLARSLALWNLYGPTETTIWSAVHRVESFNGIIPIGRPITNTQFYILDRHLQPVPLGVPGDLYIGGDGEARGYLNRPDLTAEKFIPNPFSAQPGTRLYKTGDRVRYRADGNIEFLGRCDNQVKIRGFRIELGEIESVLSAHPVVREAVVVVRKVGTQAQDLAENLKYDARLVAYVVAKQEPLPTDTELRNYLKAQLPQHMIPSAFLWLKALPLTANGKVDRRQLPEPDNSQSQRQTSITPRTPMEIFLAGVWQELLGVDHVSLHDNFFDLGGHSLLSMKVIAQIEQKTGRRLNPRELIFGSLERLAAICDQEMPAVHKTLAERLADNLPKTFKRLLFSS